jgi:hypothetical protein
MGKPIPKACRNRHHSYPSDEPGAACAGCGRVRGARSARALGAEGAQSLRAALGVARAEPARTEASEPPTQEAANISPLEETAPAPTAPAPTLPDPQDAKRKRLAPRMAARLTKVFDAATDWAVERSGRVPNDAEEEDLDDFREGLTEWLTQAMPNVVIGPKTQMGMAAFFIIAEKAWNAERVPPKPKPAELQPVTPPAAPPGSPSPAAAGPAPSPNGAPDADSIQAEIDRLDLPS